WGASAVLRPTRTPGRVADIVYPGAYQSSGRAARRRLPEPTRSRPRVDRKLAADRPCPPEDPRMGWRVGPDRAPVTTPPHPGAPSPGGSVHSPIRTRSMRTRSTRTTRRGWVATGAAVALLATSAAGVAPAFAADDAPPLAPSAD